MYPNIIIAFNIAQNTMVGKIIIKLDCEHDNDLYIDMLNATDMDSLADLKDLGSEFLDDIQVGDVLHICTKWFKLPNIVDLINKAHVHFLTKDKKVSNISPKEGTYYFENEVVIDYKEAI